MTKNTLTTQAEFRRGCLVLFACFCGVAGGIASVNFYTSGIFIIPIEKEFGWSRAEISAQSIFGVLLLVIGSPFIGRIIDKIGVRSVAVFSLSAYAACLLISSYVVVSLWSFYAMAIITATLALGSSPITFTRVITGWFDSARGLALGISLMGTGIVAASAPALLTDFVTEHGWRPGYRALALFIFIMAIIVWLFIKDDPIQKSHFTKSSLLKKNGVPFKKAIKSRKFQTLAFIFLLVALAVSGIIIHFIPMLLNLGITTSQAGKLAAVMGISVMIGRLITGFLVDRFYAPTIAAILFGLSSIGFILFLIGGSEYAIVAAVSMGISMGAEVDLIGYLVSKYFGLGSYGSIYGALYSIFLVGASTSPLIVGYLFDMNGHYHHALSFSAIALAIACALSLSLEPFPE